MPRGNSKLIYDVLPDGSISNKSDNSNHGTDFGNHGNHGNHDAEYDFPPGDDTAHSENRPSNSDYAVFGEETYDSLYDVVPQPKIKKSKDSSHTSNKSKDFSKSNKLNIASKLSGIKSPFNRRKEWYSEMLGTFYFRIKLLAHHGEHFLLTSDF